MNKHPSYVVFAGTTGRCGLGVRTIAWTRRMAEAGYPVTLIAYQGDFFSNYLRSSNVRVIHLPLPESGSFFRILYAWLKGLKGIKADRAVLARGVGGSVSLSILLALWFKFGRLYTTEHAQADLPEKAWGRLERNSGMVRRLRNRLACKVVYRSLAVSEATRQSVIDKFAFKPDKIVTRYAWFDDERFRPDAEKRMQIREKLGLEESDLLIGYVGRMVKEKQVELILDGFCKFSENYVGRAHLVMVGNGPLLKILKEKVHDKAIQDRVNFVGVVDDASPWMASFDIAVLASSSEAFALVGIEAMASAVLFLAPNVGGLAEYVVDRENGFLATLETEEQFAAALSRIVDMDPTELQRIRQSARETAINRFAPNVAMSEFLRGLDAEDAAKYVSTLRF